MYSRKMTNDMRSQIGIMCKTHLETERAKNPLQLELNEKIAVIVDRFKNFIFESVMPEADWNTIMKYKNQSQEFGIWIRKEKHDEKKSVEYVCSNWNNGVKLIVIDVPRFIYYAHANKVIHKVYGSFNEPHNANFIPDLYELAYILDCEEKKAKASIKTILEKFNTTGKLVEAYPEMEKFIPAHYKLKENRTDPNAPAVRLNLGVDITSLLN